MIASMVTITETATGFSKTKINKNVYNFLEDYGLGMGKDIYLSRAGFDAELLAPNGDVIGVISVIH